MGCNMFILMWRSAFLSVCKSSIYRAVNTLQTPTGQQDIIMRDNCKSSIFPKKWDSAKYTKMYHYCIRKYSEYTQ